MTTLQRLEATLFRAQSRHLSAMLAQNFRCGKPGGGAFDAILSRRFEQQVNRLEKLFDRMTRILDRLSADLGGGDDWFNPRPKCSTGNTWQSAWNGYSEVAPGTVIAGSGRIWGDPHFIGADGGKYDVQGEAGKVYNLLSDDGFQMNGRFDAWGGGGATVVGKVGINAKGDEIIVDKSGKVTVNGREVRDGERVRLTHGGYVSRNGSDVTVKSGEWKVDFQAKTSRNGGYLNMDVTTRNAVADGVKPHGLLGQTFDGDGIARNGDKGRGAQGGGAIENLAMEQAERGDKETIRSYEVASLTDTKFSSFNRFTDWSGASFDAKFDDFFAGGFANGWGFTSSDQAMRAVETAYGSLALSLISSTSMYGWGFGNNKFL